jgi:hypothetical protein
MAQEIRVLESLRAGQTDDAIRALEQNLDIDILLPGDLLKQDRLSSLRVRATFQSPVLEPPGWKAR